MKVFDEFIRRVDASDIASMPPGMPAMCQRILGQPITYKMQKMHNMFYRTEAFVVKLGPAYVSKMTERARRLLVVLLWLEDFMWAQGSV